MKMVVAYLRPEQLPAVKESLFESGIPHLTAMPVMGTAPLTEQRMYRGVEQQVTLFRRVRVEITLGDDKVEPAIEAITRGAKEMGGWGRIFVLDVHDAVNIWTGKRGDPAL